MEYWGGYEGGNKEQWHPQSLLMWLSNGQEINIATGLEDATGDPPAVDDTLEFLQ